MPDPGEVDGEGRVPMGDRLGLADALELGNQVPVGGGAGEGNDPGHPEVRRLRREPLPVIPKKILQFHRCPRSDPQVPGRPVVDPERRRKALLLGIGGRLPRDAGQVGRFQPRRQRVGDTLLAVGDGIDHVAEDGLGLQLEGGPRPLGRGNDGTVQQAPFMLQGQARTVLQGPDPESRITRREGFPEHSTKHVPAVFGRVSAGGEENRVGSPLLLHGPLHLGQGQKQGPDRGASLQDRELSQVLRLQDAAAPDPQCGP